MPVAEGFPPRIKPSRWHSSIMDILPREILLQAITNGVSRGKDDLESRIWILNPYGV